MRYERVFREIVRTHWAMEPEAFRALAAFVESGAEMALEPGLFHAEAAKPFMGTPVPGTLYSYRAGGLGMLMVDGPIIPRATAFSDVSGMVSLDKLTEEFKAMAADPTVARIALMMDTPGGAVTGVSDFAALVSASPKPTSAFTWYAASAGYWIAVAADEIISPTVGMVGSIGVVSSYLDTTERDAKAGVRRFDITSSQSPDKRVDPATAEGAGKVREVLDQIADVFGATVAEARGVSVETVWSDFGGGNVVVAARALDVGMIDGVMDLESFMLSRNSGQAPQKGRLNMSDTEISDLRAEERARIQGIEGLLKEVSGAHPSVISAARDALDAVKYEGHATVESARAAMLSAVVLSQNKLLADMAAARKEATEAAAAAATAGEAPKEKPEDALHEARVGFLVRGRK